MVKLFSDIAVSPAAMYSSLCSAALSLSPSALHPVLGGEGSKKVPSDSPPLEQTHLL